MKSRSPARSGAPCNIAIAIIINPVAGNFTGVEECAFQKHILRARINTAALSAHDAGKRQYPRIIGNDQYLFVKGNGLFVEQGQRLSLVRLAHSDRAG